MNLIIHPKKQDCGCHAPHVHCPVGDNLQQRFFLLGVDIDAALAAGDKVRYEQAKAVRAEAEAAYMRHVGMFQEPDHVISAGVDWTQIERDGYPALVQAMRKLTERVQMLEAALAAFRTIYAVTPPLPYTVTATSQYQEDAA